MTDEPVDSKNTSEDRLDNWDEIASYFRRDKRTVQRWEKNEGLPIHRHSGPKGRVWAVRSELQAWWSQREAPFELDQQPVISSPPFHMNRKRLWILIASLSTTFIFAVAIAVRNLNQTRHPQLHVPDRLFARVQSQLGAVRVVSVGGSPGRIKISPDGKRLYVLNHF